tara:strand:+ start:41 stop:676 length:636 start_codon:yes stop_codon:yes gene_type:complete
MSVIKNIIFDLGGVILNINYEATIDSFENLGVINFKKNYSQKRQTDLFDKYEKGLISSRKFISTLKKMYDLNNKQIINAWNAMLLDLPKKRLEFILNLKKDYKIFLLSNTNEIHIKYFENELLKLNSLELYKECFNKIYYSFKMKDRKPNASCFNRVINENCLLPMETLFIDDSTQHISGANKLGIRTFLIEQNSSIIDLFPHIIQQAHRL